MGPSYLSYVRRSSAPQYLREGRVTDLYVPFHHKWHTIILNPRIEASRDPISSKIPPITNRAKSPSIYRSAEPTRPRSTAGWKLLTGQLTVSRVDPSGWPPPRELHSLASSGQSTVNTVKCRPLFLHPQVGDSDILLAGRKTRRTFRPLHAPVESPSGLFDCAASWRLVHADRTALGAASCWIWLGSSRASYPLFM